MDYSFDKAAPATSDELSAIRRRFKDSKRYAIFLWRIAIEQHKFNLNDVNFNNPDQLIGFISIDMGFMKLIRSLENSLLPDDKINFISDRKRLLAHFETFYNAYLAQKNITPIFNPLTNLSHKEALISNIDALPINHQDKLDLISEFKRIWTFATEKEQVYKFFKSNDRAKKIEYLLEWIRSSDILKFPRFCLDYSNDEEYVEIFFQQNFQNPESIELVISKFKKAWSNKSYRGNLDGKKQCNIALDTKCIKILDDLSREYGYSKAEILQFLLLGEKKHGIYIAKRLKEVQLLNNP